MSLLTLVVKVRMMIEKEKLTIHYGKEINRHREFNAMIINLTLLLITMHEMNDTSKPCLTQIRVIEH